MQQYSSNFICSSHASSHSITDTLGPNAVTVSWMPVPHYYSSATAARSITIWSDKERESSRMYQLHKPIF